VHKLILDLIGISKLRSHIIVLVLLVLHQQDKLIKVVETAELVAASETSQIRVIITNLAAAGPAAILVALI